MAAWTMIGVPTSAGAHHAGQDRAPAALRKAGLAERLTKAGVSVHDAGDLRGGMFAVDRERPEARNLAAVVRVAGEVADAVAGIVQAGGRPLVVGGDCTITLGVVAGFRRVHSDVGLAYVDGDADLGAAEPGAPQADASGILDATGIAHLLGRGTPELAGLDGSPPLLAPERLAMIGCDPREIGAAGRQFLAEANVSFADGPELAADPEGVARRALTALARRAAIGRTAAGAALPAAARPVVVHFDVDVVDSGDLPLGNYPHYGSGTTFEQVIRCLRALLSDPSAAALVLTEVNPGYDPDGSLLDRYVDGLVTALAG
jgi:arginase